MSDDFAKYVTMDKPPKGKSHPNKIAYQPDDADWSLDRIGELDEFYRTNFKRSLPLTNKGQGSIHNKMGFDHRNSSDISVNPSSPEGQRLMDEMRARKIPFLAFTGPVPGASTGAHIHAGRPSHRTANKYQVGAQVRKLAQSKPAPTPDDFDKYVSADDATDDFDKYVSQSAAPKPKKLDISKVKGGVSATAPPQSNIANVDEILTAARTPSRRPTGPGPRSPWEGATASVNAPDTGIGALRRQDEQNVTRLQRAHQQATENARKVREQQEYQGYRYGGPDPNSARAAASLNAETLRIAGEEAEAESRRKELISSLTAEDRTTIRDHANRMLGMDPISRGIEKGSTRIGSGLLYKLAAASDLLLGTETEFGPDRPNAPLSAYLRRQAGRGELDIEQIEAELPPGTAEQWSEFITQMAGSLPELYGATALGGPVGGFAALGGLESMGRGESTGKIALATTEGAALGKMFGGAGRVPGLLGQGVAIAGGTVAIEKAFGAEDADALRSAATNVVFHTAMKAPAIVSRLTAAAERAYVKPDGPGQPTVGDELQSRLADIDAIRTQFDTIRTKETPVAPTIPTSTPLDVRPSQPKEVAASEARTQEAASPLTSNTMTRPPERPAPGTQKPEESVPASVKFMITKADEAALAQLGYSPEQINRMKPVEAQDILSASVPAVERRATPRTPEGDIDWANTQLEKRGGSIEPDGAGYIVRLGSEAVSVRNSNEAVSTARELLAKEEYSPGPGVPIPTEANITRRSVAELMADRAESGPTGETPTATPSVTEPAPEPFRLTDADRAVLRDAGVHEREMDDPRAVGPKMLARVKAGEAWYQGQIQPITQEIAANIKTEYTGDIARFKSELVQFEAAKKAGKDRLSIAEEYAITKLSDNRGGATAELIANHKRRIANLREGIARYQRQANRNEPRLSKDRKGEAGFLDITEVWNATGDAIESLRSKFPDRLESEVRGMLTPERYADHLKKLPEAIRDDIEYTENYPGYSLYEARNLMPKAAGDLKFKKLTDRNANVINNDAEFVANVKGEPYLLNKWEDPDAPHEHPKVFVWAYEPARWGGRGKTIETSTSDPAEVMREMEAHLTQQRIEARRGEAGFIDPREISEGIGAGIEKVREKLGDELLTGKEGATIGAPLAHNRQDIAGKEIVATTADGRAVVPNEANKSGVSVVKPHTTPEEIYNNYAKQGRQVDIDSVRKDWQAGRLPLEDAVKSLKQRWPNAPEAAFGRVLAQEASPLIGAVNKAGDTVRSLDDPRRSFTHGIAFTDIHPFYRWRYEPSNKTLYWNDKPPEEVHQRVENYLANQKGYEVANVKGLMEHGEARRMLESAETEAFRRGPTKPSSGVAPSRTSEAADRELLSRAGAEYQRNYKALEAHPARRQGLNIANDDIATDYFSRLRRFAGQQAPEKAPLVDQAEQLFAQGKYRDATTLAETVLGGTHDYPSRLNTASVATYLAEKGVDIPATKGESWTKILQEVRRRMGETGPLSGGGATFYDVNKYPEGGRPDHAKIAYILEPVIEGIRTDARRLIAEGKLRAEEYLDHVRKEFSKIVSGTDFTDWHPLNRAAALGVVVEKLRAEGPPTGPPPAETATGTKEPGTRARSLPKTIAASGREQIGTDTRYTPQPNDLTEAKVAERIARDGAAATEEWLRNRQPETFAEEVERTEAFRQLSDAYQTEAVFMADTRPQEAVALHTHAVALTNREFERSTSLGQGVQAYVGLKKYEPAGALLEAKRLAKKAKIELPPAVTADISTAAVRHQQAVKEVTRLKGKVAALEADAPRPTGAATTGDAPRPRAAGKSRKPSILPSKLEAAREQLGEAQARRRAAKRAVAQRLAAIQQSRTIGGYYKRAIRMNKGLMVSQLSTAMRNLQSQVVRYDVERLTDLLEHTIRTRVGMESDLSTRDIWRATKRQLDIIDKNIPVLGKGVYTAAHYKAKEILSDHPQDLARMFNDYAEAGEIMEAGNWRNIESPIMRNIERVFQTGERAVEMVNIFNRVQEFHLRSAEFLAELDLHVRKEHGMSLEKFITREGMDAIPRELIGKAVDKALEVTFSSTPSKDGPGGKLANAIIDVSAYIPPTVSPAPFARFMFNNAKFLYQYNITGLADIAITARRNSNLSNRIKSIQADGTKTGEVKAKEIAALNAEKGNVPRAVARTIIGSSMLLLAYQFRQSDYAGEKWYELKFGDTTVDARPFGPFSTYLFFAESIRRKINGEKAFTVGEIALAFGASSGPGGTGIAIAEKLYDYAANDQWDKWQRVVKTELGDLGRSLLTPVRQVKDFIAAFDESQAITRDTSDAPVLGPIADSIPYASMDLPPAQRATTADPIKQEHPVVKQLTGWRVESAKNFLEQQLDELHFTSQEIRPNTGIGQLDALEKRLMGPMMDQLGAELEKDEAFKSMGKAARADFILEAIKDIRSDVRSMGKAERPELYDQLKEERKPQRKKDLEREQQENSPGLSSALRLGVPMPIPSRNTDEDDVSYRARLIQLGRQRRATLDTVANQPGFSSAPPATQRKELYAALGARV